MDGMHRTWVTVDQAAREVGISPITIRDWYRAGTVDTVVHPSGRVVDLDQVRSRAMGFAAPSPRREAPAGRSMARPVTRGFDVAELQQLARERLEV